MKFLGLLSLAASASAASAWIAAPRAGDIVTAGSELTVDFTQVYPATPITPVGLYIAITACKDSPCQTIGLGEALYAGPWKFQGYAPGGGALYSNFTVTIPASLPAGTGNLTVTCVAATGAGYASQVHMFTVWTNVVIRRPSA